MEQQTMPDFMVVDDDPINNMICRKTIQATFPGVSVKTFTSPESGLEYMQSEYGIKQASNVVLFLDINMPTLNGWDVLDRFKDLPDIVKEQFTIFMLSSSIDPLDKQKSDNDPFTTGYITKPLNQTVLHNIQSVLTVKQPI
jgi:CheY-like chemotaxis protein